MIEPLLQKCRDIDLKLQSSHHDIPVLSSTNLQGALPHHLKSYQMIGLKWLYSLYIQNVSGTLADQMGLGKTVRNVFEPGCVFRVFSYSDSLTQTVYIN